MSSSRRRAKFFRKGYNTYLNANTKLRLGKSEHALHAEVMACLRVPKHCLQGTTLYVVRVRKTGTMSLSQPCQACTKIIERLGIERVYYSA